MLPWEDDVEIHALKKRGWSISRIAKHTGRDRKTVRAYLNGERTPGVRRRTAPDPFERFEPYARARLDEDPHLWALTLFDELQELGYDRSYQTLTRQIRTRGLRPACSQCGQVTERANAIIEHPPGEETQFDWLELPDPPASWGLGRKAFLLVGSLPHSGKWRAVLAPAMDQAHLMAAMTAVLALLGGLTRIWRFDRMSTVAIAGSGDINPAFAGFAKHHGVQVALCPPRSGHRKGVVEKNNHTAAQRWWRTLPESVGFEGAQTSIEAFARKQDGRRRLTPEGRTTAAAMAEAETAVLRPLPAAPYPVVVEETRAVTRQALVSWRGNRYSVPPELAASTVTVAHRLGDTHLDIRSGAAVVARHRIAEPGLGATIRDTNHVIALNAAAMNAVNTARPHRRKERIPPGPGARAAAAELRGARTRGTATVIDLAAYEAAAQQRNYLP